MLLSVRCSKLCAQNQSICALANAYAHEIIEHHTPPVLSTDTEQTPSAINSHAIRTVQANLNGTDEYEMHCQFRSITRSFCAARSSNRPSYCPLVGGRRQSVDEEMEEANEWMDDGRAKEKINYLLCLEGISRPVYGNSTCVCMSSTHQNNNIIIKIITSLRSILHS